MEGEFNGEANAAATYELPNDESLPRLLAALAAGARAVQEIPLNDDFDFQSSFPEFSKELSHAKEALLDSISTILNAAQDDDDEEIMQQDEWNRQKDDPIQQDMFDDLHDPLLWESCADACDALVEKVEVYLQQESNKSLSMQVDSLNNVSGIVHQRAQSTFGRLAESTVDMEKPQETYGIKIPIQVKGGDIRTQPFIPTVHPDKPFGIAPLDISMRPGHGLDSKFGNLRKGPSILPDNLVAPNSHVPHVYQKEIESFQYQSWQLESKIDSTVTSIKKIQPIQIREHLQATWIDTVSDLQDLSQTLLSQKEIAVDLEAHSYRTFYGMTCLMQISIRPENNATGDDVIQNYLIDVLKLWNHINAYLAPVFANPNIVKVMHGADSDIPWLQRDFGIYVVNLFDTGRAARALKFTSAGLAYLLTKYVPGLTPDKSFQLSDWRQRPIPYQMKKYAIMDTHYLLDIYDRLLFELDYHSETSIKDVLDTSRLVCLIRYTPEPFNPNGYNRLMKKKNDRGGKRKMTKIELNAKQEIVLEKLWDWRDLTARTCDESLMYVCPNQALLRISMSCPSTISALHLLLNPIPPLVLRYSQDILDIIKTAPTTKQQLEVGEENANSTGTSTSRIGNLGTASSSAFFKPAEARSGNINDDDRLRRGMLSPVLGTEALYKQAGWITPQDERVSDNNTSNNKVVKDVATTTASESDCDDGPDMKPRHLLSVNSANQNYRSKQFSNHTLEMGATPIVIENDEDDPSNSNVPSNSGVSRGRSTDGMGAARVVIAGKAATNITQNPSPLSSSAEENVSKVAHETASRIRKTMSQKEDILGLISPNTTTSLANAIDKKDIEHNHDDDVITGEDRDNNSDDADEEQDEEEFVIPRSMREIYKISNRNRRNKKVSSPTPDRAMATMETTEDGKVMQDDLAKAEEILKSRGTYFETEDINNNSPGGIKRQRTKSSGTESEEGGGPMDSSNTTRDDDIAFMQSIGWVKDKEEAESIIGQRRTNSEVDNNNTNTGGRTDGQQQQPSLVGEDSSELNDAGGGNEGISKQNAGSGSFDYSSIGPIGAYNPNAPPVANPFFSGAAVNGGPLAQNFVKTERKRNNTTHAGKGGGKANSRRHNERPEKRGEGRTYAYKKR